METYVIMLLGMLALVSLCLIFSHYRMGKLEQQIEKQNDRKIAQAGKVTGLFLLPCGIWQVLARVSTDYDVYYYIVVRIEDGQETDDVRGLMTSPKHLPEVGDTITKSERELPGGRYVAISPPDKLDSALRD